jgi:lysozyme family protein
LADFKKSWAIISSNEGGYVNNSKDPGKETYRGISIRFWSEWEGWMIVHNAIINLKIDSTLGNPGDMLNMAGIATPAKTVWLKISDALKTNQELDGMVQAFYKLHFWDPLDLDKEPDQSIADSASDAAVNKGMEKEKKSLAQSRREADEIV